MLREDKSNKLAIAFIEEKIQANLRNRKGDRTCGNQERQSEELQDSLEATEQWSILKVALEEVLMEIDSTSKEQSFYIAVILYESSSSASEYKPLYEECFVLIKATSWEEANEKALTYARGQEGSYQNQYNETITWSLKQVVDVSSVLYDEFDDGTELYARHFRNYEAYRLFEPLLLEGESEL